MVARGRKQQKGKSRWSVEKDGDAKLTFSCYGVIKSERLFSYLISTLAIWACCHAMTIVSASLWQYSKQAWYIWTLIFHTKAYHMVHTNIHFSHQGISHGTYEHWFFTPRHITWYIQTYIFTPKHITWYIWTFILHTKAYHMVQKNIDCAHHDILHCTRETFILHTGLQDSIELWGMSLVRNVSYCQCVRCVWGA